MSTWAAPYTRALRGLAVAASLAVAGCAGTQTSGDISLVPAKTGQETQRDGWFSQPLRYEHTLPGCSGQCPALTVDSLVFPGHPQLTSFVDHALATMTGVTADAPPYDTIEQFERHFWKTAGPRDTVTLTANVRYANQYLTVLELASWQYLTGAAHGITATQFLNWDNRRQQPLGLNDILEPGGHPAYVQALRNAHAQWLGGHAPAAEDPENFTRLWPFQPSDNAAVTDQGLVVKYDSYQIAPYSSGQPELLLPYEALRGIIRPAFLPQGAEG